MIVEGHGMVVETGEDLKVINSGVSSKKITSWFRVCVNS